MRGKIRNITGFILSIVGVFLLAFFNVGIMRKMLTGELATEWRNCDSGKNDRLTAGSDSIFITVPVSAETMEKKYAYLTFDDGPSKNTDKILDILEEKGVKATFFVVGKEGETAKKRYRRIVEEGHSLGIHSYSHDYSYIYQSLENYKKDVLKLKDYLQEVTGEEVWLYRFPGGSSNSVSEIPIWQCIEFLEEEELVYFDWNASSEDAVAVNADGNKLNHNILKDALRYNNAMILMHDLYECDGTVDGLGTLIDRLQEEGYEILPITKETEPIQHRKK